MAGEQLPARFSLRSKLWFRWKGKCCETATSHMQTVTANAPRSADNDGVNDKDSSPQT